MENSDFTCNKYLNAFFREESVARRRIREFDAKRIICNYFNQRTEISLAFQAVLVDDPSELATLPLRYPFLLEKKLVVKPDQLFGKRNKYDLVKLNVSFNEVIGFIKERHEREININGMAGRLTTFIIEPYLQHLTEFYLAFSSERNCDRIFFSVAGGVNVDENWEKVISFEIPTWGQWRDFAEKALPEDLQQRGRILFFMENLFKLYLDADFTYLELNPFTIDSSGTIFLLDAVAEVDDCAEFKNRELWGNLLFPEEFAQEKSPEEKQVSNLNKKSGASLKLTLLNPSGRIWSILSGGGASIIYLDALSNCNQSAQIANYGEYSGNPTAHEAYEYAKIILGLICKEHHPEGKILFIAGGIANFTEVKTTFSGIAKALEEFQQELRRGNVKIYVRRGGPYYQEGLRLMEETGKRCNLPIWVFGPQTHLTEIVPKALEQSL